ncbi:hypothetical protein ONZ45_g11925 [Pleurotus djamor]|nr:hypothetical protein ONZ45_g11925 [Pleurotus djamor]
MKLKEIRRTSTFAWSPASPVPLLATGTVAGALDESFSNESQLEIWEPDFLNTNELILGADAQQYGPKGVVTDTARFNRLAWSFADATRTQGILAAGMENGELVLWDAHKIINGAGNAESLIQRNSTHTGPIRGLDFNPVAPNLLSSGGVNGEVYVWDMKDPSHPYSPGTRSTKLDEITSVAWNSQVQHVLAGASTTGYTVVWDLRGKREVVALAYGGGTGTLAGQHVGSMNGLAVGGRRGMSDIAWHPDNATRLVTASEDDSSPIIMVWDLRNARAPEKILTGHEKGVLSLSWCKQDADLLLSCGKDNRALCWNPQTSEIIGELPSAANWAFQVDWCPRNPSLLATAFFDGTIGIHSIQSTNEASSSVPAGASSAPIPDGAGLFDSPSFGTSNEFQSNVQIRNVVTEPELVERARKLRDAMEADKLNELAEERVGASNTGSAEGSKDSWKALLSLFRANSRDELVTLLGFSKEEVAVRVSEAVERLKVVAASEAVADDLSAGNRPVVSFVEPEREGSPEPTGSDGDEGSVEGGEKTPSEVSTSVVSDVSGSLW